MFWKKKQEISKRTKKILIEDLKTLKNQVLVIGKEIENMSKYIEGLK
jgi:hypothetical protein